MLLTVGCCFKVVKVSWVVVRILLCGCYEDLVASQGNASCKVLL